MGLLNAQSDEQLVYLWPDCVHAWNCWQDVQTQWRHGMAGPTGLDYASVWAHLAACDLDPEQRREVYACIRACERATLEVWADRAADQPTAQGPAVPGR